MNQKAMQTIKPTIEEVQDKFGIWRKIRKKCDDIRKRQKTVKIINYF